MNAYFVTGTDTEVGKTYVSAAVLNAAASQGKQVVGYKPVSAGCEVINDQASNEDARALFAASNIGVTLQEVNPVALMPPIAPHIAAQQMGITIDKNTIVEGYNHLQRLTPDLLLMEGAGGWRLPLSTDLWMPEIVQHLNLEVILVVGMRLGCLNHAMLTCEAIQRDGLSVKGWIANQIDPNMPVYRENLQTLIQSLPAPLLAEVPHQGALKTEQQAALVKELC